MPRILITAGVDSVGSFRTVMRRSSVRPGRLKWLIPRLKWIQVSVISLFWLTGCQPQAPDPDYSPPHSPQAALDTFDLAPGFEIEVFAAEPLIRDPVAMEIDEDGRIYVVETGGYPLNTEPIGRVRLLLDQDGDGLPDESFVFADGLVLPTGVMRWKNGILVTAAPDLLYLEDSDGDGQADVRETVLTGFAFSNPQHTVNLPVYGLDNWIYLANEGGFGAVIFQEKFGDRGGRIHYPDRADSPVLEESHSSVRLQPDSGGLENLSAPSQFGHSFDEWGRYFTLNNAVHARHVVIAAPYLRRNPDLFLRSAMHQASDHGTYSQVFPITHNPRFELLTEAGKFTSGCSLTHYLGGGFGPELGHFSLVAEPVHNLVHMDVWSESGSTFTASRVHEESEFLASTDNWFRPVFFYTGPDGSIYLVDYYREMIEHPEWTSSRYHEDSEDLYRGTREGRIYRIFPQGKRPSPQSVQLSRTPSQELVSLLGHRNGWWRRTAQRLLVDRQSRELQPDLLALLESSPLPLARLHALWTLEGLGRLGPEPVLTALSDAHPGVRENAVILSERYLSESDQVRERMLGLAADASQRVRYQVLLSSGFLSSPHAGTIRDRLLLEGIADPWVPIAALSASSDETPRLLELAVSRLTEEDSEGARILFRTLASVLGARQKKAEVSALLARILSVEGPDWWKSEVLTGLMRGTRASASTLLSEGDLQEQALRIFLDGSSPLRPAALELVKLAGFADGSLTDQTLERAAIAAADPGSAPELRTESIQLLSLSTRTDYLPLYSDLLAPSTPEAIRVAAIQALGPVGEEATWEKLISGWRGFTPPVRDAAGNVLVRSATGIEALLEAMEEGLVSPWTLGFRPKRALLMNRDPDVRERGRALLEEPDKARQEVLEKYKAVLSREGNAVLGHEVYRRECSKCHQLRGEGRAVGPDLETVRTRPAAILLRDILQPSESVAPEYQSYVVERVSGGIEEGVLKEQTPQALILLLEEAQEMVIPRDDIRRFYVADVSAMPGDMETLVSVEEMAHLLRFLKTR